MEDMDVVTVVIAVAAAVVALVVAVSGDAIRGLL